MADTSQQELTEPHTNGVMDGLTEEEKSKMRPADIEADVREMERRRRVEMMMNSKLFREELERIIETQMSNGSGPSGLLQQISDMMGAQGSRFNSNVFKNSNCVMPINDIRGVESMGYAKGEKLLRCKLAAVFRLLDLYGWTQGVGGQITARLNQDQQHYLVNPYGLLYHEVTASSLVKVDMQGQIVEQGTTNFGVHIGGFQLHSTIHAARPDIKCIIHITTPSVTAVSSLKGGILPIGQESIVIGEVSTHQWIGEAVEPEEKEKIARNLGPINKVMLLTNRGALCCGETIEEAFYNVYNTVLACETQLKLMPAGLENISLISEEAKKAIFEASRRQPVPHYSTITEPPALAEKLEKRWRIGSTEFEALMRMLDNAGFRTGYIYRHPLVKSEPPRPRNDVEVPPAVSSLGYLLEEEENYRQGLWKGGRKGFDRTHWLNSPNVYQKVEILETGTPDPKKITKWVEQNAEEWVSEGSPTHSSTPVRIDSALQFVPKNTNPREFKTLQQQIKDNRRADKISAGPQSHILEGVSWEEAKKMQDASISATGESVVLVGAASKGIIQRGFQHNAMVYKTPYAKNPFDAVTDQELDQYKKEVARKTKGDPYEESQSESEALSSFNISRATHESSTAKSPIQSPVSVTSETEEESRDEPRVLRIEKKKVPAPSQPEVVLSDGETHGHAKVDDANRTVAVRVTEAPQVQHKGINDFSKHNFEADATTQFLNEMRRCAMEPRNESVRRDNKSSTSDEDAAAPWWSPLYQTGQIQVIRLDRIAERQKPQITSITIPKSPIIIKHSLVIPKFKPKPYIKDRCKFFNEYDKRYKEYKTLSSENFIRFTSKSLEERIESLSPEASVPLTFPESCKVLPKNRGFVREIARQFSSTEAPSAPDNRPPSRKRSSQNALQISPSRDCITKVPRLSLPLVLTMADLESPSLVNTIMKFTVSRPTKSEGNPPSECLPFTRGILPTASPFPEMIDTLTEDLRLSSSSEPTNSSVITIAERIYPEEIKLEVESDDENGNSSDPLPRSKIKQEPEDSRDLNLSDENGNSLKENTPPIPECAMKAEANDWINETEEELKLSFEKDMSDDCPWRFSSPLPKFYNREDSMTEVINTLNVNLTPSKMSSLNYLPDTHNSRTWNLDPNQFSVMYSLTPTADVDEDPIEEHFNCGKKNCEKCLYPGYSHEGSLNQSFEAPVQQEQFYWEEMLPSAGQEAPEGPVKPTTPVDLNQTIDLFDNSIDLDTERDMSADSIDHEQSVGGSDLLELPHSTFVELEKSRDQVFHEDMATSANEVIAGLGEREALVNAEAIVDDVLSDVACLDLNEEFSTDLRTILEAKLTALKVAKHIIDEVMDEMGLEINQELREERQIREIEEIVERTIEEDTIGKEPRFIVIGELIHHIIDRVSSGSESPSGSSPGSYNLKRTKENANTEIKELANSMNEEAVASVTPDLLKPTVGLGESPQEGRRSRELFKSSENLINEIKSIFNEIDIDVESEESMREELEQIVASCCIDQNGEVFSSDMEAFQHYANQMQLIAKAIIFEESLNKSKSETLNSSSSTESSLYANKSESVKKFVAKFKEITKGRKTSVERSPNKSDVLEASDTKKSDVSGEMRNRELSLDVDVSVENTINVSSQSDQSSPENDTKSDDSREKVELTRKKTLSDLSRATDHDEDPPSVHTSDENFLSEDFEKNVVYMWDLNESESERSFNEIRGKDASSTFVQFDEIDDLPEEGTHEEKVVSVPGSPKVFQSDLLTIPEDEELKSSSVEGEEGQKDRTLSPILEDEEVKASRDDQADGKGLGVEDCLERASALTPIPEINDSLEEEEGLKADQYLEAGPPNSPEIAVTPAEDLENESEHSGPSSRTDFFSCTGGNSTPFQTGQSSADTSVYTKMSSECGDEPGETGSARLNSEHDTYTISECDSDDCRETVYQGDVSSNLRRSDSFSTINFHDNTSVNLADVSSALEELELSRMNEVDGVGGNRDFVVKCPICDNVAMSGRGAGGAGLAIPQCSYCSSHYDKQDQRVPEESERELNNQVEEPDDPVKRCNICLVLPVYRETTSVDGEEVVLEDSDVVVEKVQTALKNDSTDEELGKYDVCFKCLMILSVDTREFIQIERMVSSEDLDSALVTSPAPAVPDYEDTTLCKVINTMNLTDVSVNDRSTLEEPLCFIRTLFE
ncbi:uncharacterized protein LOC107040785 isoform X3 [Diachasma alloeum]|nr:uncharacterized protein LOC107040785 isoform X3 [Diachasma alloeum]XP_015116505.1 uncharacterized protein LOC107040785 isoform X3 [Diachasma alloeum]XP_015116506.1 uncharacterized protein LOC107040785 isoform X3 [Diachasma alloeum]XP_015116508.1 uncharacterized protein LOC107040785 isoform X3 [Diachasma alloeum]XP_015116509.1 uncharacterized protein LOC107040785 isoform X3 [Diachasma alloeum]